MKPPRPEKRPSLARQSEAMVLFGVGDGNFAIAASAVEEIRNADGLRPLPRSPVAKVQHLLQRAGKTYYVVDAGHHFRMLPMPASRLLVMRRGNVALQVQRIDRMGEVPAIYALPGAFHGEERRWYRGLAVLQDGHGETEVIPIINPDGLLDSDEAKLLAMLLRTKGAIA
jgi:chemotaxis signal transduction protein